MGFRVSVTGGLDVDTLKLLKVLMSLPLSQVVELQRLRIQQEQRVPSRMKSNEFGGKSWYVQLEFMKRQPQHTLLG